MATVKPDFEIELGSACGGVFILSEQLVKLRGLFQAVKGIDTEEVDAHLETAQAMLDDVSAELESIQSLLKQSIERRCHE